MQRIGAFEAEPGFAVHTAWDIGIGDDTAIWFFQIMPGVVRLVGYYANSGESLMHYLDVLEGMARETLWTYGTHHLPHDVQAREWTHGHTRVEVMLREVRRRRLGKHVAKVPNHRVDDGINAVRQLLSRCQFDAGPCAEGIRALKEYRKDWDEERGIWRDRPRHDSASHGADAFRSLAMSYRDVPIEAEVPRGPYDPLGELIEAKPREWKYLIEMNYEELHEACFPERRRERV